MRFAGLAIAAILPFLGKVLADCEFEPMDLGDSNIEETDEDLCTQQDDGVMTFSMTSSLVSVPTFDGDNALEGTGDFVGFILYDNKCNVKGVYKKPDCGIPYLLSTKDLDWDLKLTSINTDTGSPKYRFAYGAGSYGNGENDCHCKRKTDGLEGLADCRCPFPKNGDGSEI